MKKGRQEETIDKEILEELDNSPIRLIPSISTFKSEDKYPEYTLRRAAGFKVVPKKYVQCLRDPSEPYIPAEKFIKFYDPEDSDSEVDE